MQIPLTVYYSLLVPDHPGPRPLLIVLHGFGQTSAEFIQVFRAVSGEGVLVAAPQAPHQFYTRMEDRRVGCSWLTAYQRDQSIQDFAGHMDRFYQRIRTELELDEDRVFLLGFSQGVSMAYRAWVHSSLPVKGVIACGGDLPPDIEERLESRDPLPVLLIHGEADQSVPLGKAQHAYRVLSSRNFPVRLFTFPGGHRIPRAGLADILGMVTGGGE